MFKRFFAVLVARNKEFTRDRGALIWNLLFPFLIILGFAFTFSGKGQELYKVGVYHPAGQGASPVADPFLKTQYVQFIPVDDLKKSIEKVKRHQLDFLIAPAESHYWVNSTSPKGYFLERTLWGSLPDAKMFHREDAVGAEIRYVDWLIPGILALNMSFSALFGVGYTIVRYRKNGVLKRLKATPLSSFEFLAAQVASRLFLIFGVTSVVFIGSKLLVNFQMNGSYLQLFVILLLGATCMISLGLLMAARISSEELEGGLLNLITWPMMFLSGVWFSLEGAHPWILKAAQIFPLTHIIDSARSVMIDGATWASIAPHLMVLAVMSALFLALGSFLFRWN